MFKTEVPLHIPAVIQSFWPSCVTRQRKDQCWVVFKSRRGQNAMTAKLCETGRSWGWQWNGNDLKLSSKEKRQLVLQIISNFLEANKANLISFNCQSFKKLLNTCRLTWQQKSPHFYMVSGFPCCFIMEHPLTLIVWAFTNLYNVNNRWHYAAIKHHRHLISPLQPWITYAEVQQMRTICYLFIGDSDILFLSCSQLMVFSPSLFTASLFIHFSYINQFSTVSVLRKRCLGV